MGGKNINLMPEDSRNREHIDNKVDNYQPDLVIPKKESKIEEISNKTELASDIKDLSLNNKKEEKKSFFTNLFKKKEVNKEVDIVKKKPELKLNIPKKEEEKVEIPKKEIKDDFALPQEGEMKFHEPKRMVRARLVGDEGGVDLIPLAAKVRNWNQIIRLLFSAFLISIFILAIFYSGLLFFERNLDIKQKTTTQEISEIHEDILSFDNLNKEIEELGKQIALVYNSLNKHIYWTNFFELLEEYTLDDVNYSGFSAGNGGVLTLNAIGSDFDSVSKQLQVLENSKDFITDIKVSSAALSELGVSFSITLTLDPDLFYYQES